MKKLIAISLLIFSLAGIFAETERSGPATFFLVVDKSLSMEESGAFNEVQRYLTTDFIPNCLRIGDKIIVYQFYGKTEKVIDMTFNNESDKAILINKINSLKADGPFTDVGNAIDTVRKFAENDMAKGLTTFIMLSDLKQEADWNSAFAGTYQFQNRYMKSDRFTYHGNTWYEIQIQAAKDPQAMAKQLYSIISASPSSRYAPTDEYSTLGSQR